MLRRVVVGVLAGALVVAGCSSDDDSDATSATTDTTTRPTAPTVEDLLAEGRPLDIAHAGGERDYPKETLFAFSEAAKAGADVLEMDVHLSQDGQIVAIHNDTVDATTNGHGAVANITAAALGKLDAAYWFAPGCGTCDDQPDEDYKYRGVRTGDTNVPDGYDPTDFGIATLQEIFARFPDKVLDIEIKGEGEVGKATAKALADEIDGAGRTDSVVVVSFDQATVDEFHSLAPDVAVSPGVDALTSWFLQNTRLDGYSILQVPPSFEGIEVVTPETLARAHNEGLAVWVWMNEDGQDTPEYYQTLLDMGVNGIIADHPGALAELMR
ncbi:MAG TPA: glycerophosphodiester phosphodiesterase family protein [Acidimicrobiales bacterium]